MRPAANAEEERLRRADAGGPEDDWRLFGPYLSERQWGTVREDYSATGACWDYFPHDHARSRAYRFGEDGLLGFTDRKARLCFAIALWNGRDPILKERLFGLAAPEGNHGEDVKELYYYEDATPTSSYCRALYKYPLWAYPYARLVRENAARSVADPEFEIEDTGVFDRSRYVDVTVEYAKASPRDIAIRLTLENRFGEEARLHVLPQLWFRNTWSWGLDNGPPPSLRAGARHCIAAEHAELGRYLFEAGLGPDGVSPELLFTGNETNMERLFGAPSATPYVKDAFHACVVEGRREAVNPAQTGTRAAAHYRLTLKARGSATLLLRLASEADVQTSLGLRQVEATLAERRREADAFFALRAPARATEDERSVLRQGYASLLWSRQFYAFDVARWREGDPAQPKPPAARLEGRNRDWTHLRHEDLLSVPDKWEYPWYAAWDLAFHMIPLAALDIADARRQLCVLLEDRALHPSGQIPAYEFGFGDVNPPVHAWACLRVYALGGGRNDPASREFLESVFPPLLRNFHWWRQHESRGDNGLPGGGFLGLDNVSAFERGVPPPSGGRLEQADGAGWLAFLALSMLEMAVEVAAARESARTGDATGDIESVDAAAVECLAAFDEIEAAINRSQGGGVWHEEDGFFYDHVNRDGERIPLRIRSVVGLIPALAVCPLDPGDAARLPRLQGALAGRTFLSVVSKHQLERLLTEVANEDLLLGPTGVRSLSKRHREAPFGFAANGNEYRCEYAPDDSRTSAFGINSNWRGPVWLPLNHLLIEALRRYAMAWGTDVPVTLRGPNAVARGVSLDGLADEIERRLASTFLRGADGERPCHRGLSRYRDDPHFKDLVLFHEYFSGDTGRGFGASHQTGWSTLALAAVENRARAREDTAP